MSFPPELEPHAHPTLDSASDYLGQTRVSDSLESSGSYIFNNLGGSPELESHAHPTLDSASGHLGQTNVSDSLESSGSYVFNNLESSGSEMYPFNDPGSLEGSSSSLPHNSGPMIIDLDGPHTGGSSFNAADTQHSNTSAVTSFQFIDVDMDEASGAHSSNEPKRSRG